MQLGESLGRGQYKVLRACMTSGGRLGLVALQERHQFG
jgi:hypothetical protein